MAFQKMQTAVQKTPIKQITQPRQTAAAATSIAFTEFQRQLADRVHFLDSRRGHLCCQVV
jgi:hypothetical protein